MNVLPEPVELLWTILAYAALGTVSAVVVAVVVGFFARRFAEPARAKQLSRGAVGVVLAMFAIALLSRLTGTELSARVLVALPAVLSAVLLVVVGLVLAPVARTLAARGLDRFRPGVADVVAPLVSWLVLGLALLLAAEQLGIETGLLRQLVLLLVGGVVLAAAVAVGLGTRELVAAVVAGRHVAQIVAVGDRIQVAGLEGTVVALGHASVRLDTGDGETEMPNAAFLAGAVVVLKRAAAAEVHPAPERRS